MLDDDFAPKKKEVVKQSEPEVEEEMQPVVVDKKQPKPKARPKKQETK